VAKFANENRTFHPFSIRINDERYLEKNAQSLWSNSLQILHSVVQFHSKGNTDSEILIRCDRSSRYAKDCSASFATEFGD
jgi:hypothetical protein